MRIRMLPIFALVLMVACKPATQAAMAAEPVDSSGALVAAPLALAESAAGTKVGDDESGRSAAAEMDDTEALVRKKAPKGISESYFACIGNAQGAIATAECMASEKDSQDARLNKTYKELIKLLNNKSKSLLVSAQREWLVFQAKDGEFENSLFVAERASNLQLTEDSIFRICKRANDLEYYLLLAKDD